MPHLEYSSSRRARSRRSPGRIVLFAAALLAATAAATAPASAAGEVRVHPGMSIRTDDEVCSIGMLGHIGNTKYAVTAGHCFEAKAAVSDENGHRIGTFEMGVPDGEADDLGFALVRLSGNIVVSAKTDDLAISAVDSDPTEGQKVCKTGARTGTTCGTISAVTATHLRTTFAVDHGDSGGIVYSGTSYNMGVFVGMVVGMGDDFTLVQPAERLGDLIRHRGPEGSDSFRWYVSK
ncbi:hypothetical protein BJY24_001298 [Nocardia transvalensis]|uniref:Trypsin n=1 Tax=Nocardia transvalensis TaxID=37333 RepID=A0A7W9PAC9_9NOCA|nr:hypothetical protein [Nocardia transvalensis]MBB5912431.1 hypothetical protein [Nocardia transvalensis]